MKESNFTSEQSFDTISQMINTAKGNFKDQSFYFLLWGWVCVFANVGTYYLINHTDYSQPHLIWLITFPAAIASAIYGYRQGRNSKVKTYADRIGISIWIAFGINLVIMLVFMHKLNYFVNPLIMMFAGAATFISGTILKFTPLKIGGALFWVFAIIAFNIDHSLQYLITAASLVCGYLVPGYMLKNRAKNG